MPWVLFVPGELSPAALKVADLLQAVASFHGRELEVRIDPEKCKLEKLPAGWSGELRTDEISTIKIAYGTIVSVD